MIQGFAVKLPDIFVMSFYFMPSFLPSLAIVTLPYGVPCFKGATVRKQRDLELRRTRPVRSQRHSYTGECWFS